MTCSSSRGATKTTSSTTSTACELEYTLERKGDEESSASSRVEQLDTDSTAFRDETLGLGHAVGRARRHVGNESFAVLLGDDPDRRARSAARPYGRRAR